MSEYKTLDEFFPDGKPDGRRFWPEGWNSTSAYFVPFYKAKSIDGTLSWFGKDEMGRHVEMCVEVLFKEYTEPKEKLIKYLWVRDNGKILMVMAKDLEELDKKYAIETSEYTRLDWSATEFDDE